MSHRPPQQVNGVVRRQKVNGGVDVPKLVCPCGFVHDLSPIPDDGWVTVRDRDYI
jgi:hypothetical protein